MFLTIVNCLTRGQAHAISKAADHSTRCQAARNGAISSSSHTILGERPSLGIANSGRSSENVVRAMKAVVFRAHDPHGGWEFRPLVLIICAGFPTRFGQRSVGLSTPWSVKDLSPLFWPVSNARRSLNNSRSLPSFTMGYHFLCVQCCWFWTQISHGRI
jgi:hypothetical protein